MNAVKCNMCFDRSRKKILVEEEMVELYLRDQWGGQRGGEDIKAGGRGGLWGVGTDNLQQLAISQGWGSSQYLHAGTGLAECEHLDKEFWLIAGLKTNE